ncbi:MAG TPA: hypothetical protein VN873_10250 [Candidatus Angelobacter sp.]|nr:hypothetical protein [Candidatus Angelobacter sp.]
MKHVFFTLASARSGTLYLRDLFRNNVADCASRHEPFFDWGNPTLFGPAIYDAFAGRVDGIRARLAKKRGYIERLRESIYLESSHAFLKSTHAAALEIFPDLRLIHLVRDPLYVAKSETYRQEWRRRVRAPFHFYEGDDGRRHFCWALTGNEEIFRHFEGRELSLFQWYLLQWIEIENRAMRYLEENRLHDRCFTLESFRDLNDAKKIKAMFDFFDLPLARSGVVLGQPRNKSIGHRTIITAEDERQWDEVLRQIPPHYLEIFQREPYGAFSWSARLRLRAVARELENA